MICNFRCNRPLWLYFLHMKFWCQKLIKNVRQQLRICVGVIPMLQRLMSLVLLLSTCLLWKLYLPWGKLRFFITLGIISKKVSLLMLICCLYCFQKSWGLDSRERTFRGCLFPFFGRLSYAKEIECQWCNAWQWCSGDTSKPWQIAPYSTDQMSCNAYIH